MRGCSQHTHFTLSDSGLSDIDASSLKIRSDRKKLGSGVSKQHKLTTPLGLLKPRHCVFTSLTLQQNARTTDLEVRAKLVSIVRRKGDTLKLHVFAQFLEVTLVPG